MKTTGVIIAGLPATGKTTYLALIYHAIVEERADGLSLGRFDDDRAYVTEISDVLLGGGEANHTLIDDERSVTLSVTYNGTDFRLEIPDLSGETWEHALVDRRWSTSLAADIAGAVGFIVFVHSKEINVGLTIIDAVQAAAALIGDDVEEVANDTADRPTGGEGDDDVATGDDLSDEASDVTHGAHDYADPGDEAPDDSPRCKQLTQVSLVELLQFFVAVSARPIRVSVVISAWDLEPEKQTPEKWLAHNMPLLAQFLEVNGDEVEGKVWGVSAQGGNFADEKVRDELLNFDPLTRAYARAANGDGVGIAAPLRWALRLDE